MPTQQQIDAAAATLRRFLDESYSDEAVRMAARLALETAETIEPGLEPVEKVRGYCWPGVVVARFTTLAGLPRVVVECTVPEVSGALHIYAPEQIRARSIEDTP